ncbi:MAG: hypothetical protein ACYS0G_03860 [Planctomycetota bacterium]|jgi:hypothetical protein
MRIELCDAERCKIGRIDVDPARRPTRVRVQGTDREVFLDWDTALDDACHLRRCVTCGCQDLFRTKAFPQITGFVVVLAFTGAVIGALGLATTPPILIAMVAVLVADVAIFFLAKQRLVCHRCRSSYHGLPIARYHRRWDRTVAERHAPPLKPPRLRGRAARRLWWPRRPSTTAAEERTIA